MGLNGYTERRLHVVPMRMEKSVASLPVAGLAGWLLKAYREYRAGTRAGRRKHMRVVETLALGAKQKLLLVTCGGERFLVGTGPDSVSTIVRVRREDGGIAALREQI